MNFITQLLPGLRDVRGPLIAGYLWLFAAWLIFGAELPDRGSGDSYRRIFELGDVIGPIALAAAVSVAAYLVGSLLEGVAGGIGFAYKSAKRRVTLAIRAYTLSAAFAGRLRLTPGDLYGPPFCSLTDSRWVDGNSETKQALEDLVTMRFKGCRKDLDNAFAKAREQAANGAVLATNSQVEAEDVTLVLTARSGPRTWEMEGWTIVVGKKSSALHRLEKTPAALPSFSAARDLFGDRATIKTRLIETAQHAGSEVERLYAESDLRFVICFPLAAVSIALAVKTHDCWWLALLVAAGGLLLHSVALRKLGGREMVEALRSRPDEVNQIAPVFKRYEEDARELVSVLEDQPWSALGATVAE